MKIAIAPMTVSKIDYLVEWLEGKFDEVELNPGRRLEGDELVDFVGDAEVFILGVEKLNADVASKLAGKKCIKWGIGIDNIDFAACNACNIDVFRTTGLNARAVSELAVGYVMLLLRNQHISYSAMMSGRWHKVVGKQLADAKIGILGYGMIGELVNDTIDAIAGTDENIFYNDIDHHIIGGKNFMRVKELFSECDLITIHIDNDGGRNNGFVGEELIGSMKNGAYIVNTARGAVIDYKALENNLCRLGGAALDVFPDEPNFPDFLIGADNVMFSSHIAGNSEAALRNGADFVMRSARNIIGGSDGG